MDDAPWMNEQEKKAPRTGLAGQAKKKTKKE
jgi:hypothetical protein